MSDALRDFLIERKFSLLMQSKSSTLRRTRELIEAQIRCIEAILIFYSKQGEEQSMEKLNASLDDQIVSLEDIRARQRKRSDTGLTKFLLDTAEALKPGQGRVIPTTEVKPNSVATRIHYLVKHNVLPKNVTSMRAGAEIYMVKKK